MAPATDMLSPIALVCDDSCTHSGNGRCEDGTGGATESLCAMGTDCGDCGPVPREELEAAADDTPAATADAYSTQADGEITVVVISAVAGAGVAALLVVALALCWRAGWFGSREPRAKVAGGGLPKPSNGDGTPGKKLGLGSCDPASKTRSQASSKTGRRELDLEEVAIKRETTEQDSFRAVTPRGDLSENFSERFPLPNDLHEKIEDALGATTSDGTRNFQVRGRMLGLMKQMSGSSQSSRFTSLREETEDGTPLKQSEAQSAVPADDGKPAPAPDQALAKAIAEVDAEAPEAQEDQLETPATSFATSERRMSGCI